jgi:hypothetical protein
MNTLETNVLERMGSFQHGERKKETYLETDVVERMRKKKASQAQINPELRENSCISQSVT